MSLVELFAFIRAAVAAGLLAVLMLGCLRDDDGGPDGGCA